MPDSSDDPANDRTSAGAPSAQPAEGQGSELTSPSQPNPSAGHVSADGDPQGPMAETGEAPRLPRRRRRRRRRPPRTTDLAQPTAAPQGSADPPTISGDALQSGDLPASPPAEGGPRRRRRRRRGPRRDPGSAEVSVGGATEVAEGARGASPDVAPPNDGASRQDRPHEQPGGRRRPRRPPRPADATTAVAALPADTPAGAPRYRSTPYKGSQNRGMRDRRNASEGPSHRGPVGDDRRSPDRRARGKGPPSRDERRQGRDRDASRRKPEQRLYALEAIVDRGFEDVVDAAEENPARRVHWTIIKRTVADQESGKPISATYLLRRDGVDAEFPGLAAARAAANKTIVHPEKLTLSKAEHAAAKNDGRK
jgi:hypothetical protein